MTRLSLRLGANSNVRDYDGETGVQYALCTPNAVCLEALLKAGARLDYAAVKPPLVALAEGEMRMIGGGGAEETAAAALSVRMAKLLLKHGANLEAKDKEGHTTLFWIVHLNNFRLAR